MRTFRNLALSLVPLAAAMGVGCHKTVVVTQYPVYWPSHVRTVAVLPFRNATPAPEAGLAVSDAFAAALAAQQTCQVLTRQDYRDYVDEARLQEWVREEDVPLAGRFRGFDRAQAFLIGTVTAYSTSTAPQEGRQEVYAYDPDGSRRVVGYKRGTIMGNTGDVAVTVQMIDREGRALFASSAPVHRAVTSTGTPPPMDGPACRAKAVEEAVGILAQQFAPVQRAVPLDKATTFFTASEKAGDQWKKTKKYDASAPEVVVVLRLPPSCAGNRFQVTVIRKGSKHVASREVGTQDIVWREEDSSAGLVLRFPMADLLRAGGGPGDYTANFLSGGRVTLHQDFKIGGRGD
jgi:hypothetical protein